VHQLCREIALPPLTEADVGEYLAIEMAGGVVPEGLAALIYRYSEGNPLFMVAALEHMRNRDVIAVANGIWQFNEPLENIALEAPESLRQMIELQIERLSADE
jgi:predicted ATPase